MLRFVLGVLVGSSTLGCYASHSLSDRVGVDAATRDGGSPVRIDGAARDSARPDAGEACPVLRYQPLDRRSRLLIAHSVGDPIVTVVDGRGEGGVATAELPWTLGSVPSLAPISGIGRVFSVPQRARDRTWLVGDRMGVASLLSIDASGAHVRRPVEGAGTSLAFDGDVGLRWRRDPTEYVVVRSTEEADDLLPVVGDPAVLAVLDPTALDPAIFWWNGAVVVHGRSFGAGPSWIARLELEPGAARITHAISQPAFPNPYRCATAVATADRFYTASSMSVATDISIRELDESLTLQREEIVTIGATTGSCQLEAIGGALALFCSIGTSGTVVVHRPFSGGDWVTIPYVPSGVTEPHAVTDIAWVDEHRALVSSQVVPDDVGVLSLICVP